MTGHKFSVICDQTLDEFEEIYLWTFWMFGFTIYQWEDVSMDDYQDLYNYALAEARGKFLWAFWMFEFTSLRGCTLG